MPEDTPVLTNTAAAIRLRTLLHQLATEPPPLGERLVQTLTPTPEEHLLLSAPPSEKQP